MKSCNCTKKKEGFFSITEATRDAIIIWWDGGWTVSDVENIWSVINIEKKKKRKIFHQLFCIYFTIKYISKATNKYVKSWTWSKHRGKKERQKNLYIMIRKARLFTTPERPTWKISATLMRVKQKTFQSFVRNGMYRETK